MELEMEMDLDLARRRRWGQRRWRWRQGTALVLLLVSLLVLTLPGLCRGFGLPRVARRGMAGLDLRRSRSSSSRRPVAAASTYRMAAPAEADPHAPATADPVIAVPPSPLPTVDDGDLQLDVFSKLLTNRTIFLGTEINDEVANNIVSQLLYLASDKPDQDIKLLINSPGGLVQGGLAIFDTIKYIPCDVQTICCGMACSMGAFLLAAGSPGKRYSMPHARIMIHQPLGGSMGDATDLEIGAGLILQTKAVLNKYLAEFTSQPLEKIQEDVDRDFYLSPTEAKLYGLIDHILPGKVTVPDPPMPDVYAAPTNTRFAIKGKL